MYSPNSIEAIFFKTEPLKYKSISGHVCNREREYKM